MSDKENSPSKQTPQGSKPSSSKARGTPGSAGKKKNPKKKDKAKPESEDVTSETGHKALPEGCFPIALLNQTQELFECVIDEHVTEENPIKLLKQADIVADMKNRAAVSDFSPFKQKITDYEGEEILIIYDYEFRYGENFCIALTEEAKEKMLHLRKPKVPQEDEQQDVEETETDVEFVVCKYEPHVAKPWVHLGSENEIRDEVAFESRIKINFQAIKQRQEFGSPYTFSDRGPSEKGGYVECCLPQEGDFDLRKMELDKFIQAVPILRTVDTQTNWKQPRNACTQYTPQSFSEEEITQTQELPSYLEFIKKVTPRLEQALQQNEIMDVFFNDWTNLGENVEITVNQAVSQLKEYQSFCDLKFSKDKVISCIQWHPTIKGIVAFSVAENMSFDERIDNSYRLLLSPSLILIWSFTDPIQPQLLLQAPEDIYCFQFNPSDTNIVAGGCINGQIVLWDISQYANRLKLPKTAQKKNNVYLPGFEDAAYFETPIVRYTALSSIESSHVACITDICWVPDHIDINRFGVPTENKEQMCNQLITCAVDNEIMIWDMRSPKLQPRESEKARKSSHSTSDNTGIYQHLDLTWKPMLKINLIKSEAGADYNPTKFSISEIQGDRNVLNKTEEMKGEEYSSKPESAKDKKVLQSVNTRVFVGTEIGELLYIDWMPQKDADSGKLVTTKPEFCHTFHDGPICALKKSPFNKNVLLVVGGWNFSIWKEGVTTGPLLQCNYMNQIACDGCWSPTRPSVFYIARKDGTIDVWDVMDRTHEPFLSQNITSFSINSMAPIEFSNIRQLLAVGDDSGTLHVLEIPWNLQKLMPNELASFNNYIERETKRQEFIMKRWNLREQEKRQKELEKKSVIRRPQNLTEEDIDEKLKALYDAYLEEEAAVLRSLGLKADLDLPEK